jgi:hypothetical protein
MTRDLDMEYANFVEGARKADVKCVHCGKNVSTIPHLGPDGFQSGLTFDLAQDNCPKRPRQDSEADEYVMVTNTDESKSPWFRASVRFKPCRDGGDNNSQDEGVDIVDDFDVVRKPKDSEKPK